MTYSVGGLIQASDFTTFQTSLNTFWSTGASDNGWGQTAIAGAGAFSVVTATTWASLVNTLATSGSQTTTTLTSRTAPVTGSVIAILANMATDLSSVTTRRGFATSVGTTSSAFTGSITKGTTTGSGTSAWTIVFTQTVTFPSAAQARYFWNAGGLVRLDMSKTSTGTDIDADWNTFIGTVGTLYISGRVNGAAQTIAGTSYSGFTRIGGSGTPGVYNTNIGWYQMTAGAGLTSLFQLNSTVYPYTSDFVRVQAQVDATRTILTIVTTWSQSTQSYSTVISGGTGTLSPYTAFGTAPAVLCRYIPPSTTYLTNTWGTPVVASSVV
jgi:hypothetical protein